MRIVFLGDMSCSRRFERYEFGLPGMKCVDRVIANLEGPIVEDSQMEDAASPKPLALNNTLDILDALRAFHVNAVTLANNHICDFPDGIRNTIASLNKAGIGCFGAGADRDEAAEPHIMKKGKETIHCYGFSWEPIGSQGAGNRREGVNPFRASNALDTIREIRKTDSETAVVYYVHWGYEFEFYPLPAHRQLARELIHSGVDAVIGTHAHVAQGVELYMGKPIVYGLGNWFFPPRKAGRVELSYPKFTSRQLAFELGFEGRNIADVRLHWHEFEASDSRVKYIATEGFDGPIALSVTPFRDMGDEAYVGWFKANRRRRRGLPIYKDYRHAASNRLFDSILRLRQVIINCLMRLHIKDGPSGRESY